MAAFNPLYNRARQLKLDRRRLLASSAAASGAALAGFGSPYGSRTLAQDSVELSFWTPGGATEFCSSFDAIAAEYTALHPNITIEETQCGVGDQSFNEVLLARIAAGDAPDATIYWSTPVALAARDALTPMDEFMAASANSQAENWPPNLLASCQWQGQTYGLPVAAGTYAMVYNEELFEARGLPSARADFPKTWDELRRFSKEITTWEGDTLKQAGMIPPRSNIELPIWVELFGGRTFDAENMTYQLNSEPVIEFLNRVLEWLDDEYKGDINLVDQSANWTENVVDGRPPELQAGNLGMQSNGFWITGQIYLVDMTFERWNVAPYPVGADGVTTKSGYWPNWVIIPQGTDHAAEVFGYLDYIGVEGMTKWFEAVPDLPVNAKVPALTPVALAEARGKEVADEIYAFFRSQLDVVVPMWNSPVQDFADDQVARALERIMVKQATPQDAMTEAQNATQAELDRLMASVG
jgi:ABC-type glycerol-3-phosphate transport system substrate-binding protein